MMHTSTHARACTEPLEARMLLAVFTVTSSADVGRGTLRDAIASANADPATLDEIDFDIARPVAIIPASPMPAITGLVIIDGSTQTGFAGTPLIQLDGASAGAAANGLNIASTGVVINALCINRFGGDGIHITTGGDTVTGCRIGTNAAGTTDLGNGGSGVYLSTANNNTIGGTNSLLRNVLSGNQKMGILVSGSSGNLIEGNYVGTNAAGSAAIPNGVAGGDVSGFGIYVISENNTPSNNNAIGGTAAGAANIISGNLKAGVYFTGAAANNGVAGNLIGTNATGTAAIPNDVGVAIGGSTGNTIGGTIDAARNVISGNNGHGISLNTFNYNVGDTIQGNYIGTDITGAAALPNGGDGIHIASGAYVIGGIVANGHFPGNVISGNGSNGIFMGGEESAGNSIVGNAIGTAADRVSPLGNAFDGVLVTYGDFFSVYVGPANNNTIGGATAPAGNVIAFNGHIGVEISGVGSTGQFGETLTGNLVRRNSIYSNGGLGIDLVGTGPSPNDPGDADTEGGNLGQNFPIILSAGGPTGTNLRGTFNSAPSRSYTLDFYTSPAADTSGYGEGKTWIGSTVVTTNAGGDATFNLSLPSLAGAGVVAATATDLGNNTSEFSPAVAVDVTPPKVTDATLRFDPPVGGAPGIDVTFNEDVGASVDKSDVKVENLSSGHTLGAAEYALIFANPGNVLTIDYTGNGGAGSFPDGNYRVTLTGAGITDAAANPLDGNGDGTGGDNFVFTFFSLAGDADHSRTVDLTDFTILAANFNQTGRTFSRGNFDYDTAGKVDLTDFTILASRFNMTIAPAAIAPAAIAPTAPAAAAARSLVGFTVQDRRDLLSFVIDVTYRRGHVAANVFGPTAS